MIARRHRFVVLARQRHPPQHLARLRVARHDPRFTATALSLGRRKRIKSQPSLLLFLSMALHAVVDQ